MLPITAGKLRPVLIVSVVPFLLLLSACNKESKSMPEAYKAEPSVQLGNILVQGGLSEDGSIVSYLGLPYAKAPVGRLRWASPQPFDYSKQQGFDATEFAPACEQGPHIVDWYRKVIKGFGGNPMDFPAPKVSEDCLYLNIWHPAEMNDTPLPVIVYIHGGSNKGGWSYEPNYLGGALARQDVVVISIAYRLEAFGYLSHPEMPSANVALEDLMLALQWLQQHAITLGADPANITLMGESAGANNIAYLMAMPEATGLFQRVIHQSAGWAVDWSASTEKRRSLALKLQEKLGAQNLTQMRQIPASEVRTAAAFVFAEEGFGPVVDGTSLTRSLSELVAAGELNSVDLLIGSNADEWRMYLAADQSLKDMLDNSWPQDKHAALLNSVPFSAALPGTTEKQVDEKQLMNDLASARDYHCPSMKLAEHNGGRSWMYYFSKVRTSAKANRMGAYHGAELPYVFDTHDAWMPTDESDRALTQYMVQYWVNFARSGDPNGNGLPPWPAYTKDQQVLFLDAKITSGEHPAAEFCKIMYADNRKDIGVL